VDAILATALERSSADAEVDEVFVVVVFAGRVDEEGEKRVDAGRERDFDWIPFELISTIIPRIIPR
jgi:hypothetical protein